MGKALDVLTEEELELRIVGKKTKKAGLITYLFDTISRESEVE